MDKSRVTVFNDKKKSDKAMKEEAKVDPKVKRCDVTVKKISKDTIKKIKDDLKSVPTAKPIKTNPVVKKTNTMAPVQKKSKSTPSLSKSPKPQCPHCGKKYANIMALNYHKITFHVEEKETELFSSSAYNEQMSFDKNVLKLNNAEGRRLSLEAKSEASNPKVVKEEPKHNAEKPNPNISDRRKSIENTNPAKSTAKKRKSIEKSISLGEPTISVGYCICDKPERDDMLG